MDTKQNLDIERLKKELLNNTFIEYIKYFDEIDSTNEYAKQIQHDNVLILAEFQRLGKGRFDREWYSEKQNNLLLTIKKKFYFEAGKENYLNFTVTHALLVTIEKVLKEKHPLINLNVKIKWPNDILVNFKKISGILLEEKKNDFYIGIGVNINQTNFIRMEKSVTSLKMIDETEWNRNDVLIKLIYILHDAFITLQNQSYTEIYKNFLNENAFIGKNVDYFDNNAKLNSGIFENVLEDGKILIKTQKGYFAYHSGEIKLKLK